MDADIRNIIQLHEAHGDNSNALRAAISRDATVRRSIAAIARKYNTKARPNGCSNCYFDTLIEIIMILKKNDGKMPENTTGFDLKRGVVLHALSGNSRLILTPRNLTKELALYHLKTNPPCARLFSKVPDSKQLLKDIEDFDIESFVKNVKEKGIQFALYSSSTGKKEKPLKTLESVKPVKKGKGHKDGKPKKGGSEKKDIKTINGEPDTPEKLEVFNDDVKSVEKE